MEGIIHFAKKWVFCSTAITGGLSGCKPPGLRTWRSSHFYLPSQEQWLVIHLISVTHSSKVHQYCTAPCSGLSVPWWFDRMQNRKHSGDRLVLGPNTVMCLPGLGLFLRIVSKVLGKDHSLTNSVLGTASLVAYTICLTVVLWATR